MKQMQAFILISDHFDELFVINCVCQMRQRGLATHLVAVSSRFPEGKHGVTVQPDLTLSQLSSFTEAPIPRLLLIPGGEASTAALLADPRVHQLLEMTLQNEGVVAVMTPVQQVLADMGMPALQMMENFMVQNGETAEQFVAKIIGRLTEK